MVWFYKGRWNINWELVVDMIYMALRNYDEFILKAIENSISVFINIIIFYYLLMFYYLSSSILNYISSLACYSGGNHFNRQISKQQL